MKNLWNDEEALKYGNDPLGLRVYTSQLLGRDASLVLHGGGNTSVKMDATNIFGDTESLLYVKGSGWDLETIEREGFAPVKMDVLLRLAQLDKLSDTQMVSVQRTAMTDPQAPNPSVEAILHAIIPFAYVDHTHADAVVAITNTDKGEEYIKDIYGDRVLVIPYVMPGFILAKKVYEMTKWIDWKKYEGLILMSHGVFTFHNDAKTSYERMIQIVSQAEEFLGKNGVSVQEQSALEEKSAPRPAQGFFARMKNLIPRGNPKREADTPVSIREHLLKLAEIRREASLKKGSPVLARQKNDRACIEFSNRGDMAAIATRGPLTPDHSIRTKRIPAIITEPVSEAFNAYADQYFSYFKENANGSHLTCLDQSPRWAVWPKNGTIAFGANARELKVISDIVDHTIWAIQAAETIDRWKALSEKDIFDVEYWELEQAKLKKGGSAPAFLGKIALVTGAASGIGRATVEALSDQGASVVALDINPEIETLFNSDSILGLTCDITDKQAIAQAVDAAISQFGGLDVLVSNAGIFPAGEPIERIEPDTWNKSIDINLSSHQQLLRQCIPFLSLGLDPAIIIVASKNVPAPGPGASAYSVAKAGLTQLARIAALELAPKGIRVNVVHPNQVFDTAIWTNEVLENRASHYGMSVEEYKTSNLLKTEIKSKDVANLVCAMAGSVFGKTTGAQVPIDGGNERVI